MRKTRDIQWKPLFLTSAAMMITVLMIALLAGKFSFVSHAESAAKVTAKSATIRKEPSVSSEAAGSTELDKEISIKSQVTGSDGYTWYEVYLNADTTGYIRSDLVEITDGTTPPTGTAPAATTTTPASTTATSPTPTPTPVPDETLVDVTDVTPVSASVQGSDSVRIRQNASTTSRILTKMKSGMALTITGTANGTDGKVWYRVTFLSNGTETTGFIRSDYTDVLPEDLTAAAEEPPAEDPGTNTEGDDQPAEPEPEVKAYDTILQDGVWMLVDNDAGQGYEIQQLFDGVKKNLELYQESEKTGKTQKAIIIVLVILLVGAAAAVTLLIFKVKDMADAQYFNEVESEAVRSRSTRPQGGGQRMGQAAGSNRQAGRPLGTSQGQQRQSVQGSRPAGSAQGQQRQPAQGSRPAGSVQGQQRQPVQGSRQTGSAQGQQRQPVQGSRQTGSAQGQQRQAMQGQRQAGASQGQRPAQPSSQSRHSQSQQNSGWQSKNFMADDDEFEFEFLNYDEDSDK